MRTVFYLGSQAMGRQRSPKPRASLLMVARLISFPLGSGAYTERLPTTQACVEISDHRDPIALRRSPDRPRKQTSERGSGSAQRIKLAEPVAIGSDSWHATDECVKRPSRRRQCGLEALATLGGQRERRPRSAQYGSRAATHSLRSSRSLGGRKRSSRFHSTRLEARFVTQG